MLKYTGKGFLIGVPSRDLTDEEVDKYGGEAALIASGLYEKTQPETDKPKTKKVKKTEGETWQV